MSIKKTRKRLGLLQHEMAMACNTTKDTISSWERGIRKPSGTTVRLMEIIEKMNVIEFDHFFGEYFKG